MSLIKSSLFGGPLIKSGLINSGLFPSVGGVKRFFTDFNVAIPKYIVIPSYTLAVGDVVTVQFQAPTSVLSFVENIFSGDDLVFEASLQLQSSGNFGVAWSDDITLDGSPISNGDPYPTDGKLHTIRIVSNSASRIIGTIAARSNATNAFNGVISDLTIERSGNILRNYVIGESGDTTTIIDTGTEQQNGTSVDVFSADRVEYTQQSNGDWKDKDGNILEVASSTNDFNYAVNGLTVTFTAVNQSAPWNWNFNDGNTSSDKDPVHEYSAGGTYTVTLNGYPKEVTVSQQPSAPFAWKLNNTWS